MGGTDEPSNLVEVSVEEHAELHFDRYLTYGRWEDWMAAVGLAGLSPSAEHKLEVSRQAAYKQWEDNLVWCNNGTEEKRVVIIPEGWTYGRKKSISSSMKGNTRGSLISDEEREKKRKLTRERNLSNNPMKGKFWITNGTESKSVSVGTQIPEGWRKGRVIKKSK